MTFGPYPQWNPFILWAEEFIGLLVPFLRRMLRRTETGFQELNQALKNHAEQQIR